MIIFACVTISLSCRCLCCVFKCVAHVFYFSDFFISCCVLCMSLYAYQVNVLLCVFFCASFLVFIECSVIPLLFSCYPLGTFQFTFLSRFIFLFFAFLHLRWLLLLCRFHHFFCTHIPICSFQLPQLPLLSVTLFPLFVQRYTRVSHMQIKIILQLVERFSKGCIFPVIWGLTVEEPEIIFI